MFYLGESGSELLWSGESGGLVGVKAGAIELLLLGEISDPGNHGSIAEILASEAEKLV